MDRAASPVVGVVLMIAVVVVASGAVFAALNQDSRVGQLSTTSGDGGVIAVQAAPLEADSANPDDQVVRLTHVAGPEIEVSEMSIAVTLPNARTGEIVDLPAGYGSHCKGDPNNALTLDNVEGDDIFDRGCGRKEGSSGAITAKDPDTDGLWSPGDYLQFRIKHSGDGVRLKPGDEVEVRVVEEGRGVVARETLVAR